MDLHAEEAGGTTSVPAALFDPPGRTKMVAMAAIARFTGRNLALYGAKRDSPVPIKLRVLSPLQRAAVRALGRGGARGASARVLREAGGEMGARWRGERRVLRVF